MAYEIISASTANELGQLVTEISNTIKYPHLVSGIRSFADMILGSDGPLESNGIRTCAVAERPVGSDRSSYLGLEVYDDRDQLATLHVDVPTDGLPSIRGEADIALDGQSDWAASSGATTARLLTETEGKALVADLGQLLLFTEPDSRY